MKVLDKEGLKTLIDKIQSRVIYTKHYSNISSNTNNSFFYKLTINDSNSPWIIKYRIISRLSGNVSSTSYSSLTICGNNSSVSYYEVKSAKSSNIFSIDSSIVCINPITSNVYIGASYQSTSTSSHDFSIEIEYLSNCKINFYSTPTTIPEGSGYIKQIPCNNSGSFNDFAELFSTVAFTGDYNDLINKPDILSMMVDNNTVVFYNSN